MGSNVVRLDFVRRECDFEVMVMEDWVEGTDSREYFESKSGNKIITMEFQNIWTF